MVCMAVSLPGFSCLALISLSISLILVVVYVSVLVTQIPWVSVVLTLREYGAGGHALNWFSRGRGVQPDFVTQPPGFQQQLLSHSCHSSVRSLCPAPFTGPWLSCIEYADYIGCSAPGFKGSGPGLEIFSPSPPAGSLGYILHD